MQVGISHIRITSASEIHIFCFIYADKELRPKLSPYIPICIVRPSMLSHLSISQMYLLWYHGSMQQSSLFVVSSMATQFPFHLLNETRLWRYGLITIRELIELISSLKAIRSAKNRLKSARPLIPAERSRLSDVSAALLNVGLLNVCDEDESLRGAAYDLLFAVCAYVNYEANPLVPLRGMSNMIM